MKKDKQRAQKPRGRRAKLTLLGVGSLGIALGAGIAIAANLGGFDPEHWAAQLRQPALRLQHVDFVGTSALEAESLWEQTGIETGTAMIDLDLDSIEQQIKQHPRVARCDAVRLPPNRLIIGVRERVPVAVDAETLQGIDAQGERFAIAESEAVGIPRIRGTASRALLLLDAAEKLGTEIESIDAQKDNDVHFVSRSPLALVHVGRDPMVSLASWQQIQRSGLIDGYGAKEIDLRFPGSAVLRKLSVKRGD